MQKMMLGMMKMYQLFAWLGLIVVFVAFLFSFQGASANALFFSVDKATREAAGAGSALALANVTRHSLPIWVPYLKFLGLGLMLGAIYMATDMVTSPTTHLGCWIFGFGIGFLVVVIRLWGGLPEGVMYAILLMNAMVPFINRVTQPRVFGTKLKQVVS